MNSIITTEQVTKVFNPGKANEFVAVHEADVTIGEGELIVLRGPSGSGKTSLLSLLGCMSRPTSGKIWVQGKDVAKLPERFLAAIRLKTFGFVFQQFNLIKDVSVLENVMLPLYPTPLKTRTIQARAETLLAEMDLAKKITTPVNFLSGGEQQRVAIARALVNQPEIILADEPTAHLDTRLAVEFIEIMKRLRQTGKTIVIATHDPLVYEQDFIDRTFVMRDGQIIKVTQRADPC